MFFYAALMHRAVCIVQYAPCSMRRAVLQLFTRIIRFYGASLNGDSSVAILPVLTLGCYRAGDVTGRESDESDD